MTNTHFTVQVSVKRVDKEPPAPAIRRSGSYQTEPENKQGPTREVYDVANVITSADAKNAAITKAIRLLQVELDED